MAPVKRFRLRDVMKLEANKGFKPVKDKASMAKDSQRKKDEMQASVTQADVDEVLQSTIEQRVTPYASFTYEEQLAKKHDNLYKMLAEFNRALDNEIRKGSEVAPAWYANLGERKFMPLDPTIIHTDVIEGYRNKVEFTVGRAYAPPRPDHNELWNPEAPICVGFNRSNMRKGINFVESPESIRVNSAESIIVGK